MKTIKKLYKLEARGALLTAFALPQLFYIQDDGAYTEQKPDEVDVVNGWLKLTIHHFSRYAVAWSN